MKDNRKHEHQKLQRFNYLSDTSQHQNTQQILLHFDSNTAICDVTTYSASNFSLIGYFILRIDVIFVG